MNFKSFENTELWKRFLVGRFTVRTGDLSLEQAVSAREKRGHEPGVGVQNAFAS